MPAQIIISANGNYTFAGAGGISGSASLVQQGTGTLFVTNSGPNNFSGGVTINSGAAINIGNGSTSGDLGTGTVTDNGASASLSLPSTRIRR